MDYEPNVSLDMLDFYNFVQDNLKFRKLEVDELLFTAYDCPIEESPLDYWVEKNYFCYITHGGAKWKTPQQEYMLKVGEAAFIKKGAHRIFKILQGDFCAMLIFIPDEFIESVVKNDVSFNLKSNQVIQSDTVIPLTLDQSLSDYFKTVLNFFAHDTAPSKSLLKIKFRELIVNVATNGQNQILSGYFQEVCHNCKRSIEAIMEENFIFNLKIEDFAKLSGRSLATFNRDFIKLYKTSPGKWLKTKRLGCAKFLLETTNLNVNEIAFEVGFENTSHFIRVFKEMYAVSPLKFKKAIMNNH